MFKFECNYNYKNYIAFQRYAFRLQIPTLLIFAAIAFLICCFLNLTLIGLVVDFLVCFGLFPLCAYLITLLTAKSMSKTSRIISDDTIDTYVFTDDAVYVKEVNGNFRSTNAYPYDFLYIVCETKKHYFLFIAKNQAWIVEKSGLTEGNIDNLNAFLKYKLGDHRFKSFTKKA